MTHVLDTTFVKEARDVLCAVYEDKGVHERIGPVYYLWHLKDHCQCTHVEERAFMCKCCGNRYELSVRDKAPKSPQPAKLCYGYEGGRGEHQGNRQVDGG